jgi:hypothetical protein
MEISNPRTAAPALRRERQQALVSQDQEGRWRPLKAKENGKTVSGGIEHLGGDKPLDFV